MACGTFDCVSVASKYQWHQNRLHNNYYDNDDNETKIQSNDK